MQNNWRLGSLLGIPLYLDPSWFFILALVTLANAQQIDAPGIWSWIAGLVIALLMFSSVLLHELGHSIAALKQGIKVNSITLFLFGGVASIERESKTPLGAFLVAIAGPLVSFALFLGFFTVSHYLPESGIVKLIVSDLATINLVLTLFNLIPGLPLDGGQVLKAMVWKATGNAFTGVVWASFSGMLVGWLGIIFGLFVWIISGAFGGLWLAFIGWFILRNANAYQRIAVLQKSLLDLKAAEVMTRDYRVVEGNLTLAEFVQQHIICDDHRDFPYYAATKGRYCGMVKIADLHIVARNDWDYLTLAKIAHPLTEIPSLGEKTPLYLVIQSLEKITEPWITILSPAGAVAGVIDRGDIVRAIATKLNVPIREVDIKRIKSEKAYPSGFDLAAIADSVAKMPIAQDNANIR
jgi:Zn-dependent protease